MGNQPGGNHESKRYARLVKVAKQGTTLRFRAECGAIDRDRVHTRQVENDAAIAGRQSGKAVPTAADGKQRCVFRGRRDNLLDIGDTPRPHNHSRSAIRHSIPNAPGTVIMIVARIDDFSLDLPRAKVGEELVANFKFHIEKSGAES